MKNILKNNKLIFILSTLVLLYTLVGFLAIPKILKPIIEKNINENITQQASLEKITFNPFLLDITFENFKIQDENISTLFIEKILIDFNLLKSISQEHLAFKSLQIINPYIHIIQNQDESFNLEKLIKKPKKSSINQKPKQEEQSQNIKFQIYKTVIQKAKIKFTKLKKQKKPFVVQIPILNYTFYDMGTFKNILASHSLDIQINKNTKLDINGGLKLHPFHMYGKVKLTDLKPSEFISYKDELINFNLKNSANINLDFGYIIDFKKQLSLDLQQLNFSLNSLDISQDNKSLLALKNFEIKNLNLNYPENSIDINQLNLNNFQTSIINSKNNTINLTKLINTSSKEQIKTSTNDTNISSKQKPWKINLANFDLSNSKVSFKDEKNSIALFADGLSLNTKDLKLINEDIFLNKVSFKNSNLTFNDQKNSLDMSVKNSAINLDKIEIKESLKKVDKTKIKTSFDINNKNTNIKAKDIDFLINDIFFDNKELKISSSSLKKPYFAISLEKQEINNTQEKKEKKEKKTTNKESKSLAFDIGPLKIVDAKMSFEDKNLPIPFKTDITNLHGEFSRLHSSSSKPTQLNLEGTVDKYGYTNITGIVDINDIKLLTDTRILFKNIAIENFTPYSGKFLGRDIDSGKLNLDLKYNIRKSNLDAQNSIIISDIKLGKKIQSDDAANLPLDLAIALLEDSNGIIDLELPIKGNLDNPEFAIAPIVWKVFTNLISKAITSPFRLLASVLGIEANEIKTIDFQHGNSNIIASEKQTLDNIAKILQKKKRVAINITPSYHQEFDTLALKNSKFEQFLEKRMKKIVQGDEYKKALETIYKQTFKNKNLEELRKKYPDTKEYVSSLKDTLVSKQEVSLKELETLAKTRSENILNYLLIEKKVDKNAIVLEDKIDIKINKDAKWSTFDLSVSVKK